MSKKHKHDHEEHVDESWLIPYADLLTLLLALFIVLFATSKNLDMKKVTQLQKTFQSIIQGGSGVFLFYAPVEVDTEQKTRSRDAEESKNKERADGSMPSVTPEDASKVDEKKEAAQNENTTPQPSINGQNPSASPTTTPGGSKKDSQVGGQADQDKKGGSSDDEKLQAENTKKFDAESKDLEKLQKEIDQYIKSQNLQKELKTSLNRNQLLITINEPALFGSGDANLKPQAKSLAERISAVLAAHQEYQIQISGHTDNEPMNSKLFADNWELSSKRATNFLKGVLKNQTIDPTNFSAVGNGEFKPIADNSTAEGRAKNRRVEIAIMRNFIDLNGTVVEKTDVE